MNTKLPEITGRLFPNPTQITATAQLFVCQHTTKRMLSGITVHKSLMYGEPLCALPSVEAYQNHKTFYV